MPPAITTFSAMSVAQVKCTPEVQKILRWRQVAKEVFNSTTFKAYPS